MEDTRDLNREISDVIKRCQEVESDWLRDINASTAVVPYDVAQAIMLGRILRRADVDLARLIIEAMQSGVADGLPEPTGQKTGFSLERELATFSARFEWKRQVAQLKAAGAECEEAFWAGYQFHSDLLEKLDSIGEPPADKD